MTHVLSEIQNPFQGLRSFEPEQAHLYFGRDEQISDLIERLNRHRFLPILGMSGSGKSSLVRAGLIPALTRTYINAEMSGWRIAVLRPGRNPMEELASTLCREFIIREFDSVLDILSSSSAGLARIAQQRLSSKEKLLILVDQFEELFRYNENSAETNETRVAFVKLLLAAAGESKHPLPDYDDLPLYVITTMRSDFLGECSRFSGLPEALNQSQYLIPRLTREQQREVIERPVTIAGASIEPALVQRLLNELHKNPDQLPALQHALMRTWEQSAVARAQGKSITAEHYEAIGGIADALNRDADEVYQSLSQDDALVTRRLFQRLVQIDASGNETRSPSALSELVAVTEADEGDLKRVIAVFQERGFLTISPGQDPIVDITHESLIRGWQRLRTWVQVEVQSAAVYRRLADAAVLYKRNEASLLINPQLQLMLNWRNDTKPNEAWAARYGSGFRETMEFLDVSQKEHDHQIARAEQARHSVLQRTRVTAVILGALFLFALVASIVAVKQWANSRAEGDRSSRLLYDSNIYFATNAVLSRQFTLAQERLDELLNADLGNLRGFEWFYLWKTVHADEATLSGHSGQVLAVALSPDGKILASGGTDHTVKLWDVATRKEVATLAGHRITVTSLAFSPDGKILASGSYDTNIKLWDVATRKEINTLLTQTGKVESIVFSPDGKILASAGDAGIIKLWDVATRRVLNFVVSELNSVRSVAFSPEGKTLAFGGSSNTVYLFDINSNKTLTLSGHRSSVLSVSFSPDGKTLASASADQTVKFWDVATREEAAELSGHSAIVTTVKFSPDGKILASGSSDKSVKLWDTTTHEELATLSGHSSDVTCVAFSPDGKTLASSSDDETVKLWDTYVRKDHADLSGHADVVESIAFSPDGKTLASGSDDRTIKLWDIANFRALATVSGHSGSVFAVAFSPDGKTLASGSDDKTIKLWDIANSRELATLPGHSDSVFSVAFSPHGKTLASASKDNSVKLRDTASHRELFTLLTGSGSFFSVAFSPDAKKVAAGSADGTVKLWDTTTHQLLATFSGHSNAVRAVAFSPDGLLLSSASFDKTVKLWNCATYAEVATLSGHVFIVRSVAFSPDGKTLASVSADNTVKLWDTTSHKELTTLAGQRDYDVWSVAFSPDGKTLAASSFENSIRLWFAATDEEIQERRKRGY